MTSSLLLFFPRSETAKYQRGIAFLDPAVTVSNSIKEKANLCCLRGAASDHSLATPPEDSVWSHLFYPAPFVHV
jgi:hypothetical protein